MNVTKVNFFDASKIKQIYIFFIANYLFYNIIKSLNLINRILNNTHSLKNDRKLTNWNQFQISKINKS